MTFKTKGKQINFKKLIGTDFSFAELRHCVRREVLPETYQIKRIIHSLKNGNVSCFLDKMTLTLHFCAEINIFDSVHVYIVPGPSRG